jgi:hypothetical protein
MEDDIYGRRYKVHVIPFYFSFTVVSVYDNPNIYRSIHVGLSQKEYESLC